MKRNRSLILGTVLLVVVVVALVLAPGAWAAGKYKTLYNFKGGRDGKNSSAGLIFDAAGNLYGTTARGDNTHNGGTVFKLTPNSDGTWTESVLHLFKIDGKDGAGPQAGLIFDQAGNLYGTTDGGGAYKYFGTVFKLTPNSDGTWAESLLHSFNSDGEDGHYPHAGLIFDGAGNLYGTTERGGTGSCAKFGSDGCGTVFELTPNANGGWTESVLHSFNDDSVGGYEPYAGLILDQAGNLYGTTVSGGAYERGTVFKLTTNKGGGWTKSVLHTFNGTDGAGPEAGAIFDEAGNLYGTTSRGGAYDFGTVFKLTPNGDGSWTEAVLHSFNHDGKDGYQPSASLILDQAENLYGTTREGGPYGAAYGGYGTVFKLTPTESGAWKETRLHAFRNHPAAYPYAGLIFDGYGNLYGTTPYGKKGSVFEITP